MSKAGETSSSVRKGRKKQQAREPDQDGSANAPQGENNTGEEEDMQTDGDPESVQDQLLSFNSALLEHSKALDALKDVPAILANLSAAIGVGREDEQSEHYSEQQNDEFSDGEDDLMHKFIGSEDSGSNLEVEGTHDDNDMLEILNVSQPCNEFGENLGEAVSKSFDRMVANRPPKERIEKWKQDFRAPENCKSLAVPRVNPEIWPQLKNRPRNIDLNHQQQAGYISQALVVVSRIADKVFGAGKQIPKDLGKDLLQLSMDAGSILGLASQEMSAKRKAELKPQLNKEFATICSSRNPTTEWLFGDNVLEQLKASKSASNVIKPVFGQHSKGYRFQPYQPQNRQNLNFKRPPFQAKGGMFQPRQQQPRPFQQNQSQAGRRQF